MPDLGGLFDFTDLPPKERKPLYFITNGLLKGDKIIYTKEIIKNPLVLAFTTRTAAALVLEKRKVSNAEKILDKAEQTEEWIRFENEIQDIF